MDTPRPDPLQEEQAKLTHTLQSINGQIEKLQTIPRYYGDDLVEQALEEIRQKQRGHLAVARTQPFFGRLDFQAWGSQRAWPLYIGKIGVKDEPSGDVLVTDWRAPVSSLFYSFTGASEEAAYSSPDGEVKGIVHLKRNIAIKRDRVDRVVDSYVRGSTSLGVADEYLLYRLEERKDNRLRDIVSTIQAEQDNIIRADRNKALVIQGVAGSGKTTVALHRMAFLLYQYQDRLRASRMIIFAPNRMFLDYISDVLPELGVGGIQQTTFQDWARDVTGLDLALHHSPDRIQQWFHPGRTGLTEWMQGVQHKGSLEFLAEIDAFLNAYEASYVPSGDFSPWDGVVLPESTIHQWFHQDYRHYSLNPRRDRVLARVTRWLEIEIKQNSSEISKATKQKARQRLKSWQKKWPADTPLDLYERLPCNKAHHPIGPEDLAPLVHIHDWLNGIRQEHQFDHVVIDEAQDFSPLQLAVLRNHCPAQSFTILGDLAQNIYAFQGIRSWTEFLDVFPEESRGYFELKRSYRSTVEIIEFANQVLRQSGEVLTLASPVFRSGDPVRVLQHTPALAAETTATAIREIQSGTAETIAVVTRTDVDAKKLQQALAEFGLSASLITANQQDYTGGLSVLPVYLTKGLEFDAVVLVDCDETNYPATASNAKLLYVGCTRALHSLWVLHTGSPSPLIQGGEVSI